MNTLITDVKGIIKTITHKGVRVVTDKIDPRLTTKPIGGKCGIRLEFVETKEFYEQLEGLLMKDRRTVDVDFQSHELPEQQSAFWWFLAHADNWELIVRQIERFMEVKKPFMTYFNHLSGIPKQILNRWLTQMSSPEYKTDILGNYCITISTNGFTMSVKFTPSKIQ